MRPTGHGSNAGGVHGFDIAVEMNQALLVCAEVFCVSDALWGEKLSKTAKKLVTAKHVPATAYRLIYCNERAAPKKGTETPGVIICSIGALGSVDLLQSNDPRVSDHDDLRAMLSAAPPMVHQ